MGRRLCIFNGVGLGGEASGTDTGVGKSESRMGSVVVCVGVGARVLAEVENGWLVWGQIGRTTSAGGEMHRGRELGMVVSCGGSGEKGWRTELDLGGGESLDDRHGTATLGTEPKRAGGLDEGNVCFGLWRRYCTE